MVCRGSSHDFNWLVRHSRHPAVIRADLDFYNLYHPRAQRLHSESRDKATQCHQDATRWYVATGHQRTLRREHRLWLRLVIVAGTFIACCIPTMVIMASYPTAKDRIESPSFFREATWAYFVALVNAVVDPVVYFMTGGEFKRFLSKVKRCVFPRSAAVNFVN